jgi:hypothetical protein
MTGRILRDTRIKIIPVSFFKDKEHKAGNTAVLLVIDPAEKN